MSFWKEEATNRFYFYLNEEAYKHNFKLMKLNKIDTTNGPFYEVDAIVGSESHGKDFIADSIEDAKRFAEAWLYDQYNRYILALTASLASAEAIKEEIKKTK